ncbi:MAG: PEP-CTERM sorting domain-containing protein [Candidatus Omnitrophota bacterium]
MKTKLIILVSALTFVLFLTSNSFAALYNFAPNPANMYDLDHYRYYTWGWDNINLQPNEKIVSAKLTINQLYNWKPVTEENNFLYMHLLDNSGNIQPFLPNNQVGVYTDAKGGTDNFLAWGGQQILLDTYTDIDGPTTMINYEHLFSQAQLDALNLYAADGILGLGFDPDCHFYNKGIAFSFETRTNAIPEPSTILLLATGLLGGIGLRRKHA